MNRRRTAVITGALVAATFALGACGSDEAATTTTAKKDTTTTDGGGSAQAGAPAFTEFTATSPVPCKDGNATVTMAFKTINAVSIEIKIGDGKFESTAGYNPNESAAVASIPCSGPGESSIQLRGCTEDNECADSEVKAITIT